MRLTENSWRQGWMRCGGCRRVRTSVSRTRQSRGSSSIWGEGRPWVFQRGVPRYVTQTYGRGQSARQNGTLQDLPERSGDMEVSLPSECAQAFRGVQREYRGSW